ncbi:hypothetical protein JVU11DRAFT_4707 [Chiua virens]|nr:hypothetical protein JVU11DRAFT_4707 [Chiua virens]
MVEVAVCCEDPVWTTWTHLHPEDANRRQMFELPREGQDIQCMRLVFHKSSDLFGRVTIYELDVEGSSGTDYT